MACARNSSLFAWPPFHRATMTMVRCSQSWSLSPIFFFSSRRRHTRSLCYWSSDVCSSDLVQQSGRKPCDATRRLRSRSGAAERAGRLTAGRLTSGRLTERPLVAAALKKPPQHRGNEQRDREDEGHELAGMHRCLSVQHGEEDEEHDIDQRDEDDERLRAKRR